MREKTPKQIATQGDRLMHELMFKSWDGKTYSNEISNKRIDKVYEITWRYIDKIYSLNGMTRLESNACAIESNKIWNNAKTKVIDYI